MSASTSSAGTSGRGRRAPETFYPPRAKSWGRARQAWWRLVRSCRLPAFQAVTIPSGASLGDLIFSILVPGYGFRAVGNKRMGATVLGISLLCLTLYAVTFGSVVAWWAGVALLTLHTIGLGLLVGRFLQGMRFLAMPISCAALCLLVYIPVQMGVAAHLLPLRTANGVVIIHRQVPETLRTGDFVAYQLSGGAAGGMHVRKGVGLGRILAQPGDEVTFSETSFAVNGTICPRLSHMPKKGGLALAGEEWFVWPEFAVSNPLGEERLSEVYLGYSVIPRNRVLGIPFKRWLWRNTPLP